MSLFRIAVQNDAPQLKRLWNRSFGDTDEAVQIFLDHFGYEIALVAEDCGIITGAAYIIPTDGIRFPDGKIKSCSYIYALAVLPEYRGGGAGKELTRAAIRFSQARGLDYTILKPSSKTLFEFYRKIGFEIFTYENEFLIKNNELVLPSKSSVITSVTPYDYTRLREELLKSIVHIKPSIMGIEYQSGLGQLYSLTIGDVRCCAAVEVYGGKCSIKELLVPITMISHAVSLIDSEIKSVEYKVITPVFDGNCYKASGMIYPPLNVESCKAFLGPAYD